MYPAPLWERDGPCEPEPPEPPERGVAEYAPPLRSERSAPAPVSEPDRGVCEYCREPPPEPPERAEYCCRALPPPYSEPCREPEASDEARERMSSST